MKKTIYPIAFAAIAAVCSCQVSGLGSYEIKEEGRIVSISVEDADWDATKTAYTPGTGVRLTGDESLGLVYADANGKLCGDGTARRLLKATVLGSKSYQFTEPEASRGCSWHSLTPYAYSTSQVISDSSALSITVSPVQNPLANSFDPAFDYMIGKPFTVENYGDAATSASVEGFKRLLAPLKFNITGLGDGEKIFVASMSLSQTPAASQANDGMTGRMYVGFGEDISANRIAYSESGAKGNGISAVYASGLEALSGSWPVWFIVNPISIEAGTEITAVVSTQDSTYARTITLANGGSVRTDKINVINIDIKGDGYASEESVTTVFTNASAIGASPSIAASDGKSYTWAFSNSSNLWDPASKDNGSDLSKALNLTSRTATLPTMEGKYVTKAYVVSHAANNLSGSDANSSYLTLKSGETELGRYGFNLCSTTSYPANICGTGGVAGIALPEGYDTMEGMTLSGASRNHFISAVTLCIVDGSEATSAEEATGNDLYQEFLDGKKITINGVAYHKTTHTCDLIEMGDATAAPSDLNKAGVHFITGTLTLGTGSNIQFSNNTDVVWIGRYQDAAPSITANQLKLGSTSLTCRNVSLTSTNGTAFIVNNNSPNGGSSVVLDRCTVTTPGGVIRDANATYPIATVSVSNCSVTYGAKGVIFLNSKTADSNSATSYVLTGNAFTGPETSCAFLDLISGGSAYNPSDLEIAVTGNTFTDCFSATALCSFNTIKKISFDGNTLIASPTAACYVLNSSKCAVSQPSTVSGNTMTDKTGNGYWAVSKVAIDNVTGTNTIN